MSSPRFVEPAALRALADAIEAPLPPGWHLTQITGQYCRCLFQEGDQVYGDVCALGRAGLMLMDDAGRAEVLRTTNYDERSNLIGIALLTALNPGRLDRRWPVIGDSQEEVTQPIIRANDRYYASFAQVAALVRELADEEQARAEEGSR
jgi:hypothetical protein